MSVVKKSFQYGAHELTLETGELARQAGGSVLVTMDDTVVLVTAVVMKEADAGRDFFPLTINYQEKTFAAGKIPGGFFKREGRPAEKETLTSRLIDRPLRPLFPKGFRNEAQVIPTVLSINPEVNPDILAMIGASAALTLTGAPFKGPIGGARVGYINGEYVLNPSKSDLEASDLNLVVAGTEHAVLMVESEASNLSEKVMLGAVVFGHEQMQVAISAIRELAAEAGRAAFDWQPPEVDSELVAAVAGQAEAKIAEAYLVTDKQERYAKIGEIKSAVIAALADAESNWNAADVGAELGRLESRLVRERVLAGEPRIDGRDTKTVRPISVRTGFLPRTHGSALFTRGETQAIVVATLGTDRDAQIIDALDGEYRDRFMLHYNFPPYSVGETSFHRIVSAKQVSWAHPNVVKSAMVDLHAGLSRRYGRRWKIFLIRSAWCQKLPNPMAPVPWPVYVGPVLR